jgi:sugar O-acyltransferase (sialic acid O-acetyltransferase NeuD family)
MKEELILIGAGGHCRACIDVIEQEGRFAIAGIVDFPEQIGQTLLGYPVIGSDIQLPELSQRFRNFFIALGQIKSGRRRADLFEELQRLDVEMPVLVSPSAYISPSASIGSGTIVMHGAIVNACARIGSNCIINSRAVVEHDAVIGSHCHISTGAIVNGGARVKDHSFIGSQAMLREGIEVGEKSVIGAGVSLLLSVPAGTFIKKA